MPSIKEIKLKKTEKQELTASRTHSYYVKICLTKFFQSQNLLPDLLQFDIIFCASGLLFSNIEIVEKCIKTVVSGMPISLFLSAISSNSFAFKESYRAIKVPTYSK